MNFWAQMFSRLSLFCILLTQTVIAAENQDESQLDEIISESADILNLADLSTMQQKSNFIYAGGRHTCVLNPEGIPYCWGNNYSGQVGDNAKTEFQFKPVPIDLPKDVTFTSLALGFHHSCGLTEAGTAYCWGLNHDGQLGDGSRIDRAKPALVLMPDKVKLKKIASGNFFTCGLTVDGETYCWGDNDDGQLGHSIQMQGKELPRLANQPVFVTFNDIALGGDKSFAIDQAGHLYGWGDGRYGQLGLASQDFKNLSFPKQLNWPSLSGKKFKIIAPGNHHTCALSFENVAYCWGANYIGQLGSGEQSIKESYLPIPVVMPKQVGSEDVISFNTIASGHGDHSCGLTADGDAYCWGHNVEGQLGEGSNQSKYIPTKVKMPYNMALQRDVKFKNLALGDRYSCAMGDDDIVYCWGRDVFAWGRNEYYLRLEGLARESNIIPTPIFDYKNSF